MVAPAKILVAEDDDLTLELLAKVLGREGYEVVCVADGREAIERLRETTFDLVVTDIQMARTSGLELLDVVTETAPDTPVPYSPPLEEAFLPNADKVIEKARWLYRY